MNQMLHPNTVKTHEENIHTYILWCIGNITLNWCIFPMCAHTQLSDTSDLDALREDDDLQVRTAQLAGKACVYVHLHWRCDMGCVIVKRMVLHTW